MEEDNNMQNIELSKPASGALARDAGEVSPPPTSTSLSMQDIELTDAKSAASETGAGPSGCLERFSDAVNGRLERGFAALGSFVGRRPRLTIVLSILVALLLTAGVVRLENETRCALSLLVSTGAPKQTLAPKDPLQSSARVNVLRHSQALCQRDTDCIRLFRS